MIKRSKLKLKYLKSPENSTFLFNLSDWNAFILVGL